MKGFSIWRCAGSVGTHLSVKSGKNTKMDDSAVIFYHVGQVLVPKEVSDFLEQARKREQAQEKQNELHLSKRAFEPVLSGSDCIRHPVEDVALWNLGLETLRRAVKGRDSQGRDFIVLRYGQGLTIEEIGRIYGVPRMAVSKRQKKLQKQPRDSVT